MCSATSTSLRRAPSSRACSQPSSQGSAATWPDEEIGSSSAGPWSSPSATTSVRRIGGRLAAAASGFARPRRLRTTRKTMPTTISAAIA